MSIMYIGTINRLIWRLMAGVAEILANKHGGNSTQWLVKMQKTGFFMLLSDRNTGLLAESEYYLAKEFEKQMDMVNIPTGPNTVDWDTILAQAEILFELHNTCRMNHEQITELIQKSTIMKMAGDAHELVHLLGGQEFLSEIRASIKEESGIGYQVRKRHNENKQVRV